MTSKRPTQPPPERPKAFSYVRFSTPEQAKGDSLKRQLEQAEKYATEKGLELDKSLRDEGVSAYRGANAVKGNLKRFLDLIAAGAVPVGSYLIIESFDRISRQGAWESQGTLAEIINNGVTIVTLQGSPREYSRERFRKDPFTIVEMMLILTRAKEESDLKGERLRAAWKTKRERGAAEGKVMTARVPGWLELDRASGKVKAIPERRKVLRLIYQMALRGQGKLAIAEALNTKGVPTFRPTHLPKGARAATFWQPSYILKLLTNPAVTGTLVPYTSEDDEKRIKRRKALPPIVGYYPRVISDEVFAQARLIASESSSPLRGRHSAGPLRNILGGLLRCPLCGTGMARIQKGKRGGPIRLGCGKAKVGGGCKYHTVIFDHVERAFLEQLDYTLARMPAGEDTVREDAELANVENEITIIGEAIEQLTRSVERGASSVSIVRRIKELSVQRADREERAEDLRTIIEKRADRFVSHRVRQLGVALSHTPLDVQAVNALLRSLLETVVVDYRSGALVLNWRHGGVSEITFAMPEEKAARTRTKTTPRTGGR